MSIKATHIKAETALSKGIKTDDLIDYGYILQVNHFGWGFDLLDSETGAPVFDSENAAVAYKIICPDCGTAHYQVYFFESDYSGFRCENCNYSGEFDTIVGGPKLK